MRAALYARYSSDNQREASIADQLRSCRLHAERQSWTIVAEYSDHAVFRRLDDPRRRSSVARRRLETTLQRCSPSRWIDCRATRRTPPPCSSGWLPRHRIVTVAEGEIGDLHVGLKGAMNALYLKDLAQKTRRGLEGRVRAGRCGGGLCYGLRGECASWAPTGPVHGARHRGGGSGEVVRRIFARATQPAARPRRSPSG